MAPHTLRQLFHSTVNSRLPGAGSEAGLQAFFTILAHDPELGFFENLGAKIKEKKGAH